MIQLTDHLKFLTADGTGPYSKFAWPIGEWVEVEGDLVMCEHGIHVCTHAQLIGWINARCHPVDIRGEVLTGDDKLCVRAAKIGPALPTWNDATQRLFAADCAERVLPIYERDRDDPRPRQAIDTARRFARGEATREELSAAWAAAWAAAWDAARDAERAAAWAAAMDAAWDAAWAAARAAAWDAENQWQSAHLVKILRGELYAEFTR